MRARNALALTASALLLPGCIAMFGVQKDGLPRRIANLEKRIEELEKSRGGMMGCVVLEGEGGCVLQVDGARVEGAGIGDVEVHEVEVHNLERLQRK